jgi:hypothetical protein
MKLLYSEVTFKYLWYKKVNLPVVPYSNFKKECELIHQHLDKPLFYET